MGSVKVIRDKERKDRFYDLQNGEFFEFGNELFIKTSKNSAINLDDVAIGSDGTAFFPADEKIKSVRVEIKIL